MNRRDFFKIIGITTTTVVLYTANIVNCQATGEKYHSKKWWKQYFRNSTQENTLQTPEQHWTTAQINESIQLRINRYTKETYVQIDKYHTNDQLDKLPDKAGPYLIYRIRYSHIDDNGMPTTNISLVQTPILLEI